jgi:hypothetical protein
MRWQNRLSWRNDWATVFIPCSRGRAIQVEGRLEAENAALRHQLVVMRRNAGAGPAHEQRSLFFIQLYRWFPSILKVLTIIRPETLVRWHPAGFRLYWRWKSGSGHLVRASVRAAAARHGHSTSANCVPITLAKRLR